MLTPSRILYSACVAFLAGVCLPLFPLTRETIGVVLGCSTLALSLRPSRFFGLLFGLIAISMFASLYHHWFIKRITPALTFGQPQEVRLTITEAPTKFDDRSRYTGQTADGWRLFFTLPRDPPLTLPQTLTIGGTLEPLNHPDPRYRLAMAEQHIFGQLKRPVIIAQEPASLPLLNQLLMTLRQRFLETVNQLFSEPQAALFAGILTGMTADLPPAVVEDFKVTGLSHLIAVSGFNVTIVVSLFERLTRRLGRSLNFLCSVGLISLFVLLTGASASVVRAGILAGLFLLARFLGRKVSIARPLILTATIMALHNPLIVRYDIGFQLSFAALIGLVCFATPLQSVLTGWRWPAWLAETVAATTAAQLTTVPITSYYFGTLAIYSLPANIAIGPLIPMITALGLPLTILCAFFPQLAWLAYPFDIALRYSREMAQFIANWPGASLNLPAIPGPIWLIYYAVLARIVRNKPPSNP